MPQGQTLGPKRYFRYDNDKGTPYKLLLDQTLGELGGLTEDDQGPTPPLRFKPRVAFVEAVVNGVKVRKEIVCALDSTIYTSTPVTVTIDGVAFKTTGRRGERLSFGVNPPTPPTP